MLGKLRELFGPVAAGQDPGVDRRVERLHEAADEWRDVRQVRDRERVDAVREEVLAGPVGGVELDAEAGEVAGERTDPVAIRDR